MNTFSRLSTLKEDEKQKLKNSFLEYCKLLDASTMVKISEKLKEIN